MSRYRDQVALALRAVAVTSPTSFAWFGTRSRALPPAVTAALPPAVVRGYLADALQRELYRSFYCRGRPVPLSPDRTAPARRDLAFVDALSAANRGTGGWEAGWRVEAVEPRAVVLARDGLRVRARAADCRPAAGPAEVGAAVSVRRPAELRSSAPGFYTALGDAEPAPGGDDLEVRVYFNVTAAGAAPLVAAATGLLDAAGVPFGLKVVDHPSGFTRCDAAVLYLRDGGVRRIRAWLPAIVSACAPHLRDDVPAFAQPLAPGVAVGEHRPALGASFGAGRCRLVAEAVAAEHERGAGRLEARVEAVARRFGQAGLDIDAPYRAPAPRRRDAA